MNIVPAFPQYRLVQTCGACPEQYDVFLGDRQVGYLRLRHGCFTAEVPGCVGKTVYIGYPESDGMFVPGEREVFLSAALSKIDEWVRQ